MSPCRLGAFLEPFAGGGGPLRSLLASLLLPAFGLPSGCVLRSFVPPSRDYLTRLCGFVYDSGLLHKGGFIKIRHFSHLYELRPFYKLPLRQIL